MINESTINIKWRVGEGRKRLLEKTENERPDEVAKHGNETSVCMK
jgi:hypothetical protein